MNMTYRVPLNSQDYNVELRDSRLVKKPLLNTLIEEGLGLTGNRVSTIELRESCVVESEKN